MRILVKPLNNHNYFTKIGTCPSAILTKIIINHPIVLVKLFIHLLVLIKTIIVKKKFTC